MSEDLLRQILAAQHETNELLRQLIAQKNGGKSPLSLQDRTMLEALLPEIAHTYGVVLAFSVQDLFRHALEAPTLRGALAGFGRLREPAAAIRLGMLLQRAADAGEVVGGFYVARVKKGRIASLWSVERDPGPAKVPQVPTSHATREARSGTNCR